MIYNPLNAWGRQRDLPEAPVKSFRQQFAERLKRDPRHVSEVSDRPPNLKFEDKKPKTEN